MQLVLLLATGNGNEMSCRLVNLHRAAFNLRLSTLTFECFPAVACLWSFQQLHCFAFACQVWSCRDKRCHSMWVGYSSRARHCRQISTIYHNLHCLCIDLMDVVNHSESQWHSLPMFTHEVTSSTAFAIVTVTAGPILLCSAGDAKPSCLDQKHISGGWDRLSSAQLSWALGRMCGVFAVSRADLEIVGQAPEPAWSFLPIGKLHSLETQWSVETSL